MKTLRPYQQQAINECLSSLKDSDAPVLLMASVGSGKSLIISEILMLFQKLGKRALCLVNNAELIRNNAETFAIQGGKPSIYCASLDSRDSHNQIVFGTPQSVLNGIKRHDSIANIKFNIIVVDESHMINYKDHKTLFMRILRHYKTNYENMRVLGATGTNYRYKGEPIVGNGCLFKKQVGNISTAWLIENDYLVKPAFEVDKEHTIDFSTVKINSMGKFDTKQLQHVVDENQRLTEIICKQVVHIMDSQQRSGVFFFATTKKHAHEILSHLPKEESAIILGETPQDERTDILDKARKGIIRYLVNIAIISVGVDVPNFDTIAYLRPTESLVLFVQTMGRALRLSPGKTDALVLDFAGNIARFQDFDDPILLEAVNQTINQNQELIFPCPICETMNSQYARRCVGMQNSKRCEFYFEWKDCPSCNTQNDIVSRHCRTCEFELIDPNAKLSLEPVTAPTTVVEVIQAKYWLQESGKYTQLRASYFYKVDDQERSVYESYTPTGSEKAKNVFYGRFVKQHLGDSSFWYPHLQNPIYLKAMLNHIISPTHLKLKWDGVAWALGSKIFTNSDNH